MYETGSTVLIYLYIYAYIERAAMFSNAYGCNHPFSSMIRMKLIYSIMTSDEDNCCRLSIRRLLKDSEGRKDFNNSVLAFYPLHDDSERDRWIKILSYYGYVFLTAQTLLAQPSFFLCVYTNIICMYASVFGEVSATFGCNHGIFRLMIFGIIAGRKLRCTLSSTAIWR